MGSSLGQLIDVITAVAGHGVVLRILGRCPSPSRSSRRPHVTPTPALLPVRHVARPTGRSLRRSVVRAWQGRVPAFTTTSTQEVPCHRRP